MIFLGIDPGLDGGFAMVTPVAVRAYKTPIIQGEKRQMNLPACGKLIEEAKAQGPVFAVIEKVGAMPGQGSVSMFSFGRGYGSWLGLLAAHNIAFQEVHPRTWKKAMLESTGKDKGASIERATTLFPALGLIPEGARTPHDGMAEAVLLAEYGRRMYGSGNS
jgi:crossover junction endodeoxyribonuclease RuvC